MDSINGDYDVFLCFRGKDTRQGFTDILYEYMIMADIRVFRDDDELAIGDKIGSILEAIDSSKICIPIFSPGFADSKWCLREVTRMVELKKMIVPVFYKVSPDDVKLKDKSVYTHHFRNLQGNDHVEMDKWMNALKEAASNKGRELGDKSYTKFCKELVSEVISKLGPRKRLDIDHFVGSTNKAEVMKLLDMGGSLSQDVVYLGIYGMGGIGKTTIAKLLYNEFLSSFEHCGFLSDIREFSANKGVDSLPAYMCKNLQPKSVAPFSQSEQIPNMFRNKKILLILDDIDGDEQIKKIVREPSWFGSGSRIILTSRDKRVFEDYKAESKCDIQYLEMKELGHGGSLELFSRCAFGKSTPPSLYRHLSKRAIAYAGGLPLAITVIAKYLRNQKEVIWEEVIQKLKKRPLKEVKARLLISYESLEDEQKKIFLDIACLFHYSSYSERSDIFYMWQACGLYPRWSLEVLQSRSLVKVLKGTIDDQFYLQIHDQLRDLGRDIVIAKSGEDLTKQSRLWRKTEALEVLKCKEKQKNMIEALILNVPGFFYRFRPIHDDMVFTNEEFISFDNLRYLGLSYWSKLIGDFSNLFPKLTWLRCHDIVEVRNLAPPNLVILDLSQSNVNETWVGWSQILMLKKLKALDLSWCRRLRRTPVFPKNMHLERLDLSHCNMLEYIDTTIGKLQHLTKLNLSTCRKLKNLPESCGELHALRELYARRTSITSLPDSIQGLEKLERLNMNGSILVQLPESLGNLHSLRDLNLQGSRLTSLPDSIRRLEKLEKLVLSFDQLQAELPELPSSLKELRIECGGITDIPGIGELQSLTCLSIEKCPSLVSLVNLDKLKELKKFKLSECPRLAGVPGVGKLRSLTELTVQDCDSLQLLDDITWLEELKELSLTGCPKLTNISGLVNLKSLRLLNVEGCRSREILRVATQLQKLHCVQVLGLSDPRELQLLDLLQNESVALSENMPQGSSHLDLNLRLLNSCNEDTNLATNQLENLPGDIEGNNGEMQRHIRGLATDQSELENLPRTNTKRDWFDSPEEGRLKKRVFVFGVDICDDLYS